MSSSRRKKESPDSRGSTGAEDRARREFEELGLSPYEARLVLTLVQMGSASTPELAAAAEVPRTSAYQVLQGLATKRLVERLPGDWPVRWASPGRDEVLDRLVDPQKQRLREYEERAEKVKDLLVEVPGTPFLALPFVHLLRGPAQVKRRYDQLMAEAQSEFVMLTRHPYAYTLGKPNPAVIGALKRGVQGRVLYDIGEWERPVEEAFKAEMAAYHAAGVDGRLAQNLPVKLVVVDGTYTLMGMVDPVSPDTAYPTFLLVEHQGYAQVNIDAFEQRWATARLMNALLGLAPEVAETPRTA